MSAAFTRPELATVSPDGETIQQPMQTGDIARQQRSNDRHRDPEANEHEQCEAHLFALRLVRVLIELARIFSVSQVVETPQQGRRFARAKHNFLFAW